MFHEFKYQELLPISIAQLVRDALNAAGDYACDYFCKDFKYCL